MSSKPDKTGLGPRGYTIKGKVTKVDKVSGTNNEWITILFTEDFLKLESTKSVFKNGMLVDVKVTIRSVAQQGKAIGIGG